MLFERSVKEINQVAGMRPAPTADTDPWSMSCEGVDHGYRLRGIWHLSGPPKEELRKVMDRLHQELPQRGWKAYRFARAHSMGRQLQLDVEEMTEHHTVVIELILPSTYKNPSKWEKNKPDSIWVYMNSPCYIDPDYDAPYG
ncbi:hypothetical protein LRS74_32980 [Streptomyces sp. LX-29]|uniref:hypothetical protein n=1 Tax=Streptomyces sp. LX-29 TaxID=2900152 RepID=UPI00240D17A4|nr:hypothetical protein [Streptomyces sp. LX-29]WFB11317.1 hypothetical protein LRS74_32980 [Streptomyces sp. LX-29]